MELKGYKKIELEPYKTKNVNFELGYNELKIYSTNEMYEIKPAKVTVFVGLNPNLPLTAEIDTE